MKKIYTIFTCIVLCLIAFNASAQDYTYKEDPSNNGRLNPTYTWLNAPSGISLSKTGSLVAGTDYTITNVPSGHTHRVYAYSNGYFMYIEGAADSHTSSDNVSDIVFTIDGSCTSTGADIVNNFAIEYIDEAGKFITRSDNKFAEQDDGSFSTVTITLNNETFTKSSGSFTLNNEYSIDKLGTSLTKEDVEQLIVTVNSATELTLSLPNGLNHYASSSSGYAIRLTFNDAAFTGGDASNVGESKWVDYQINFIDASTSNSEKEITAFSFEGLSPAVTATIFESEKTITATVPYTTDLTSLVATFSLSRAATAKVGTTDQESGVTANDFSSDVVYTVTAEDGSTVDYTVTITKAPQSTEKEITAFSFAGLDPAVDAIIDESAKTITAKVPVGNDVTALVATYTLSGGASAKVGSTAQVSGTTANDFTNPVVYTVVAEDGSTVDYTVTVILAKTGNKILTFSFEDLDPVVTGVVDDEWKDVRATVPYGTDLTNMIATFTLSDGATATVDGVEVVSGVTAIDFTYSVSFYVTSEAGVSQKYFVIISEETAITSFSFEGLSPAVEAIVDTDAKTVTATVPYGTDLTNLVATFTLSKMGKKAIVGETEQESGVTANDFTNPVVYTVTRLFSPETVDYTVTINVQIPSTEKSIKSFSFEDFTPAINAEIDEENKVITADMPKGADVSELVATFILSELATAKVGSVEQVSGVTVNDFTNDVIYTITAEDGSTINYEVVVIEYVPSAEKTVKSFSFEDFTPSINATIDEENKTIKATLPKGTDVSELVASFTISDLASAKIGETEQVSGTTENDFTDDVVYTIVAEDGSSVDYTVSLTVPSLNFEKSILTYSFEGLTPSVVATIDESEKTIKAVVPHKTDVTALVATFTLSDFANAKVGTIDQVSGTTTNDFTSPVTYTVTAEDGTTVDYTVTVEVYIPSTEKSILSFSFEGLDPVVKAVIDEETNKVSATVPYGTDVTKLVATYTLSDKATASVADVTQVSGTTVNDFTTWVSYKITAEDNSTKEYLVDIDVAEPLSSEKSILSFSFEAFDPVVTAVIDEESKKISAILPQGTDLTKLVASFTVSEKAGVSVNDVEQVSGTTANDFTDDVVYTIAAEDGSEVDYTVTVEVYVPSSEKSILSFSFKSLDPEVVATIDEELNTIKATVPAGTDVTNLVATFTLSEKASASISGVEQVSGTTANDFTSFVSYKITAEDNSTKEYLVDIDVMSSEKSILEFSFARLDPIVVATINEEDKVVTATVPEGTDVTTLVATFKLSADATAKISNVEQVSGTTINDFTNDVVYTIIAKDESTINYTVKVTIDETNDISDFNQDELVIYPVPSNGMFFFKMEANQNQMVEVYNVVGKIVYKGELFNNELDLRGEKEGLYFIKLDDGSKTIIKKVIISKY